MIELEDSNSYGTPIPLSQRTSSYHSEDNKLAGMRVTARNLSSISKKPNKVILNNLNFYLEPGKMTLVLGAPSSGKSSLFKVLANNLHKEKISGDLKFNGKPVNPQTHHRDVVYVQQEDVHLSCMTVRETLQFSADLQMKEGTTEKEKSERIEEVLKLLNLEKQADTIIGDEFTRGISGGQKKRVTIGCELIKDGNLYIMDEPTTGLDSTTSVQLIQSIKDIIIQRRASCIISLLQPGMEITKHFDNLMILSGGELAYFGDLQSAIPYFESLGFTLPLHHNPAEFFQEIVDEPELYYIGDGEPPLRGTLDFANAYRESSIYQKVTEYIDNDVKDETLYYTDSSHLSEYPHTIAYQCYMVTKRAILNQFHDLTRLRVRIIKNIVMALLLGTVFWNIGFGQDDGHRRYAVQFCVLMYIVFAGFGTISILFEQRSVFYFQRGWRYHNTFSFLVSLILSDACMCLCESVFYSCIMYFMVGLQKVAVRFIFFYLIFALTCMWASSVFRMVSTFTPTSTVASTISPILMAPFILFSGFTISKSNLPNYWSWMYWISPAHYALEGMLLNEQHGLKYHCEPSEYLPPSYVPNFNASYPQGFGGNHICQYTTGEQFLTSLGLHTQDYMKWVNLIIVLAFTIFFNGLSYVFLKTILFQTFKKNSDAELRYTKLHLKRSTSKLNHSSTTIKNEPTEINMKSMLTDSNEEIKRQGCYLQWKDLSYDVDIPSKQIFGKKNRVRLLNKVSGYVKPGMMLALMGPSGAGKSTLLDVLANRKNTGYVSGNILVNGFPRNQYFERTSAYVEQMDILSTKITVKETIEFSALTRLPSSWSEKEKNNHVEYILETLGLKKLQHQLVGVGTDNLTPSQRKKLNIGIELAANPYLLFLDEPTTGLDSSAALKVMNLIKKIANSGTSVICTIHQPSTSIFKQFDHLLLLKKDGHAIYFGPTGKNSSILLDYFAQHNLHCGSFENPADFILKIAETSLVNQDPNSIISGSLNGPNNLINGEIIPSPLIKELSRKSSTQSNGSYGNSSKNTSSNNNQINNQNNTTQFDSVESFKQSNMYIELLETLEEGVAPVGTKEIKFTGTYATSAWTQFYQLCKRFGKTQLRSVADNRTRVARSIILSFMMGTMFWRLDNEQQSIYSRKSLIYFSLIFGGMSGMGSVGQFIQEKAVFYREKSSKIYRIWVYLASIILTDIPALFFNATLLSTLIYFMTGLRLGDHGAPFFYFTFIFNINFLCFMLVALLYVGLLPTEEVCYVAMGITLAANAIFSGFLITIPRIPIGWSWFPRVNFVRYELEMLFVNEFQHLKFQCTDNLDAVAVPIESANAVKYFCPVQDGMIVLDSMGMKTEHLYKSLGPLLCFPVLFIVISFFVFSYVRHQNR